MAELRIGNGFAVIRTGSNVYRSVPIADAERIALESGATIVPVEEARAEAERQRYAGQTALAGAETVARAATFGGVEGLVPGESEEARRRRAQVFEQEHPLAQGALELGTELAVDVGLGALTGGAGVAATRGARMARVAAEVAGGGLAAITTEANRAFVDDRKIEPWQAFAFGAAGSLAGRGVASGLGEVISRAKTAKDAAKALKEVADDATPEGLRQAQRRALDSTLPSTYERAAEANLDDFDEVAKVARHASGIKSSAARDIAKGLRSSDEVIDEGASIANKRAKIRVPEGNEVAQAQAVAEAAARWHGTPVRAPGPAAPVAQVAGQPFEVSLAGKELGDLGAIEGGFRKSSLEGLRASEEFKRTGRVRDAGGTGDEGLKLEVDLPQSQWDAVDAGEAPDLSGAKLALRDGRHRLKVAREMGRDSVYGTVRDWDGNIVFQGDIPLKAAAPAQASGGMIDAIEAAATGTDAIGAVKRFAKSYRQSLDNVFASAPGADRFNALDSHKRLVMKMHRRVAGAVRGAPDGELRYGGVRQALEDLGEDMRQLLEREDLWGEGAQYQRAINKQFHESINAQNFIESKFAPRVGRNYWAEVERTFDADALRPFLDNVQEGSVTREEFSKYLRAQRAKLDVLEQYEMITQAQGKAAREGLDQVDGAFARARVANEADVRFKAKQERARLAEPTATEGGGVGAMAARAVARRIPGVGALVSAWDMMQGVGSAAGALLLDAADSAAGRKVVSAAAKTAGRAATRREEEPDADTWGPFSEGYDSPSAAYVARSEVLRKFTQNPGAWVDALAEDVGWLARVDPQLHAEVTARNTRAMRYLVQHMPPAIGVSMANPRGARPSRNAMRQWARLWNAVVHPETVLQDIRDGRVSVAQVRAIKEVHPDLYVALQSAVLDSVSQSTEPLSTNRKVQLSTLYGLPGAAGLLYTPRVALLVGEADTNEQGPKPSGTKPGGEPLAVQQPGTTRAIQGGVTMGAR